ncbi:PQQ-dependent sugar dehydrogenase [Fulvivirgaceae bacterium BMA12]|uniref:PQQ-dependent sugar dehydrogenase n=1 Tax=Agaribacillus aureus TaxID=3051825 RepID=A0ABT8L4V9_9BACT|nr:PQQ-dependent sugar dehydrogenase [Fulvivirgaceae bacterium BMA12]
MIFNNKILIGILFIVFLFSCQQDDEATDVESTFGLITAFPNLSFTRPVDLQHSHDNSNKLYVVEQAGVIRSFDNLAETSDTKVFLDITDRVNDSENEQGLLGLAFHPSFENNGYFYVNYTAANPNRTVISRFTTDPANGDEADKSSELVLMSISQPYDNHNGGQIAFGQDGYLYIATGDGGSGGDPDNNGQDRRTLLGSILRIDVDNQTQGLNYAVPVDNPFVGNTNNFREEIYAYGLRNPWRMSFDPESGQLWAGDVGQNAFEEIDIIEKGGNYGWKIMEGQHCFPDNDRCNRDDLITPVWEYAQTNVDRSITGGYVYRGANLPELQGLYIYGDFVSGKIWALEGNSSDNATNTLLIDSNLSIASFGTDAQNELLICAFDGRIYSLAVTKTD